MSSCAAAIAECRRAAIEAADTVELRIGLPPYMPLRRTQAVLDALRDGTGVMYFRAVHLRTMDQLQRLLDGLLDVAMIHPIRHDGEIETEAPLARAPPAPSP